MSNIYGPVNGARKKVEQIYGSVNGARKEVLRAYGSVNGTTKVVFEKGTEYGLVEYYSDFHRTGYSIGPSSPSISTSSCNITDLDGLIDTITKKANGNWKANYSTSDGRGFVVAFNVTEDTLVGEIPDSYYVTFAGTGAVNDATTVSVTFEYSEVKSYVNITNLVTGTSETRNIYVITDYKSYSVDTMSDVIIHELTSEEKQSFKVNLGFFVDSKYIPSDAIKGYSFGTNETAIPDSFLSGAHNLIRLSPIPSSVTTIGAHFLQSCTSFNQPITIPSGVTTIGTSFLYGCTSFNQPIIIPSGVTRLNQHFLSGCTSFNQPLTIPSTITSVYREVLENLDSFVGPLTIETSATSSSSVSGRQRTLATTNPSALCYTQGITITGSQASVWKNAYSDENGTTYYRKLILGS